MNDFKIVETICAHAASSLYALILALMAIEQTKSEGPMIAALVIGYCGGLLLFRSMSNYLNRNYE